jgi:hypothetical protein
MGENAKERARHFRYKNERKGWSPEGCRYMIHGSKRRNLSSGALLVIPQQTGYCSYEES